MDPNGNHTGVMSNAGTETYTIDPLNRVTAAAYPGGQSETFAYDAAGSRTSHTKLDGTTWTSTDLGGDIVVQGSRVTENAGPNSDIDIAIRVDQATFEGFVAERFGTPNSDSAKEQTLIMAVLQGRVHGGETGLRPLRRRLEEVFGLDVDISVILRDGPFDESPTLPIGDG